MFNAREQAAKTYLNGHTDVELGDYIYNALVPAEVVGLMLKVNETPELQTIDYRSAHNALFGISDKINVRIFNVNWTFPLSSPRLVPPNMLNFTGYQQVLSLNEPEHGSKVPKIFEMIAARKEAIQQVEDAKDRLRAEFLRVWNAVQNINQLVKLWPASQELLEGVTTKEGKNVLARLQEKVVRTRNTPVEIDTTTLNAHLLMARIAE
jgi:hypothetical protein